MATSLEDLLPILAQLSANRGDRRSLASLAHEVELSPTHFQRTFARLIRESPKQYTRRLQLECAAVLLLGTNHSVLDIALEAGFESHEGFTRAFGRHFETSPREFRARGLGDDATQLDQHTQLLTHVGPCLRLFRTSTTEPKSGNTMNYDITQQPLEAMTLLCMRSRVEQSKVADALAELLPGVFGFATAKGIAMVGPPMTRYTEWGPGMVTVEAGLPVAPGSKGEGEVEAVELAAGRGAVTVHTGPYDGLGDAHAALEVYLHEHDLEAGGPPVEIYLTDPGEVPDPAEWKTKVIWPIKS